MSSAQFCRLLTHETHRLLEGGGDKTRTERGGENYLEGVDSVAGEKL